jgi:hypothetical protein
MLQGMMAGAALVVALAAPATELDEVYPPTQPAEPSLAASAYASCVDDAPWITYDVTLVDPQGRETSRDVALVFTKGAERLEVPLGTLGADDRLAGTALWPGASVDGSGTGSDWPGWVRQGGAWTDVGEGDLGWTREGTTVTVEVNPEAAVAVAYPPSTPGCVLGPRSAPAAVAAAAPRPPSELAATGAQLFAPLLLGAGLVTGGLAFVTARRRPRV